jgi:CO/xanthine dehydrogenase FAD-binding subunit
VAPVPLVVERVGEILGRGAVTEETLREAAEMAMETSKPIDDVRGSAKYRKLMVRNLSYNALKDVWGQLNEAAK